MGIPGASVCWQEDATRCGGSMECPDPGGLAHVMPLPRPPRCKCTDHRQFTLINGRVTLTRENLPECRRCSVQAATRMCRAAVSFVNSAEGCCRGRASGVATPIL